MTEGARSAAIGRLARLLAASTTKKSKRFWSDYLKDAAEFRGVAVAAIHKCVSTWWQQEGLAQLSISDQRKVALRLFEERYTEDKLAGVHVLSELLIDDLTARDLPAFAKLFETGAISNWSICDQFCASVLSRMLDRSAERSALAVAIAAWSQGQSVWQRRAACVAFVGHAPGGRGFLPELPELLIGACASLVAEQQHFVQTGVGWTLRELAVPEPSVVVTFAEEHARSLSRDAMKLVVQKLPRAERERLLLLHRERQKQPVF